MPYAPRRAGARLDLASSLRVCSYCLGDLVARPDADGNAFICIQCHQRTTGRAQPLAPPAMAGLGIPPDAAPQVLTTPFLE